ncbi:uncharacterized protein Z518_09528 [Rhinocladiella mackenziei CBS 650.93]|uniref:UAA transporter n=1 Tax=Rhinocladiella mackenziei CBS 650.93 TaxID=1442369 RepID=A0A0D2IEW3_9EURO|nr:uncharacterized protein Z518_09528 [Rhinocladiella mackenziei CBS 650.93]KIX01801.1 hypothetical protein Z518_09528 [Rhinocladiella mackenziei CBS 650.93]
MNPPNQPSRSTSSRRKGKKEKYGQNPNGQISQDRTAKPQTSHTSTATQTVSLLQIWAPTLVLIFGGCCSNVYTLESLIHASPSSGPLITAFQFLLVAAATAPQHLSYSRGWRNFYLRERAIPLRKWIIYTAYFLSVNILNNMAFKYRISIPLHIILRSAGPVTTMAVGRIWGGKKYPAQRVIAVILLFAGVVLAAISDAWSKQAETEAQIDHQTMDTKLTSRAALSAISSQAPGFALLASALLLSACMGLFADDMYSTHGRSGAITAETLFYSHAMSLPFFASQAKPLMQEFANVTAVSSFSSNTGRGLTTTTSWFTANSTSMPKRPKLLPPITPSSPLSSLPYLPVNIHIPRPVLLLLLNAMTQLLCIIGVNRLSAQSSSLTVSIVLNIRKLASLVLSIWLFGNTLPLGVVVGAALVFVGGGLYALPSNNVNAKQRKSKTS